MAVHFIDVGQGGAVFIQKGDLNILYDCGDTFAGSIVNEYLDRLHVDRIDILIPSHAHEDHMAGCIDVLEQRKVARIYHSGVNAPTKVWQEFLRAAKRADEVIVVERDFALDGIEFMVAYDSRGKRYDHGGEADNSIVVRITAGDVRLLLTGDCEAPCERQIIATSDVRADILSVGHHGSNASSSAEFLARVAPRIAVIQAGAGNQFGHPHPVALKRLEDVGAQIYRTDLLGDIVARIDGHTISIEHSR